MRIFAALVASWLMGCPGTSLAVEPTRPNIIYILADDLGYGDVQCLNPQRGKIATPNMDKLAMQGMIFTDAHSGSSVCTPTRYGIMTGRYAWRSRLQRGVLQGFSPPLIPADRLTVSALLKQHGYHTACIGKWHLGMSMPTQAGTCFSVADEKSGGDKFDPNGRIADGPAARGFDYYFGIAASLDMPPFAFIENDRFTQAPTTTKKIVRKGPAAPGFEAVGVLPVLMRKAVEYVSKSKPPFFLYLPLTSPHTPIVPSPEWQGRSGLGAYADFVMQTDWAVGQIMDAVEKAGLTSNTLVVVTSDNGCSPAAGVESLEQKGHFPSAQFRGYKADIGDGGHRVPFLVRWPGVVKPGSRCDQLVCLTDLMATCAEMVGGKLPANAGEDSVSILALLKGGRKPVRDSVVHHSINGAFAIRESQWKLPLNPGSAGWAKPLDAEAAKQGMPEVQLYDLAGDAGETNNLCEAQPEIVARLTKLLERQIAEGRGTPGPKQTNDAEIVVRRFSKATNTGTSTNSQNTNAMNTSPGRSYRSKTP